jgi:hypothetical protein
MYLSALAPTSGTDRPTADPLYPTTNTICCQVERVEKLKTSEANMGDLLEEVLAGMEGLSVEVEDSALESLTTALVKY